jgi:hypothetical protein
MFLRNVGIRPENHIYITVFLDDETIQLTVCKEEGIEEDWKQN